MAGNYYRVASNASFNVGSLPVKLKSVTVNTKGAAANILTLYDNALGNNSGNVIAVIDTVNISSQTLFYDVLTRKGLAAIMATGTPADVTIVFE